MAEHFESLIGQKSEHFVGRTDVLEAVSTFTRGLEGPSILWILGPPGVGKSSVLAVSARDFQLPRHFLLAGWDDTFEPRWLLTNLARQIQDDWEPPADLSLHAVEAAFDMLIQDQVGPLGLVIDGLDEAVNAAGALVSDAVVRVLLEFLPALSQRHPKLRIVYSSRLDVAPPDGCQTLMLPPLTEGEVQEYLLRRHVADASDVAQNCEGNPLYLQLVVDEAERSGQLPQGLPTGLAAYLDVLLSGLDPAARRQVELLALARGPMLPTELATASRTGLVSNLSKVIVELPDGRVRLFHKGLSDHLLGTMAHRAERTQELLEWCKRWPDHKSLYALRHLAAHLLETAEAEDLYALSESQPFFEAQQTQFPDDPALPLQTVQSALLAAARSDDVPAMARHLIRHSLRVRDLLRETPMQAFQRHHLERALRLADLYDPEGSIVWYLLIAWDLQDQGELQHARDILRRLSERRLPTVSGTLMRLILPEVAPMEPEAVGALLAKVSDTSGHWMPATSIAISLAEAGHIDCAETCLRLWRPGVESRTPLIPYFARAGDVAKAWSIADSVNRSQVDFGMAQRAADVCVQYGFRELARKVATTFKWWMDPTLASIVQAQWAVRDWDEAERTARAMSESNNCLEWLLRTGDAIVGSGDINKARNLLEEVEAQFSDAAASASLQSALARLRHRLGQPMGISAQQAVVAARQALNAVAGTVAEDLVAVGLAEDARQLLREAAAAFRPHESLHDLKAELRLPLLQARLGFLDDALQTADAARLQDAAWIKGQIYIQMGDLQQALQHPNSELDIAERQLELGLKDDVGRTLSHLRRRLERPEYDHKGETRPDSYLDFLVRHARPEPVDWVVSMLEKRLARSHSDPGDAEWNIARGMLASACLSTGRFEEAVEYATGCRESSLLLEKSLKRASAAIQRRVVASMLQQPAEVSDWERWVAGDPLYRALGRVPDGSFQHTDHSGMLRLNHPEGQGFLVCMLRTFASLTPLGSVERTLAAFLRGETEAALQAIDEMEESRLRATLWMCVATVDASLLPQAFGATELVETRPLRLLMQAYLARESARAKAPTIRSELERLENEDIDLAPEKVAFKTLLAQSRFLLGDREGAIAWCRAAAREAEGIPVDVYRMQALSVIAEELADQDELDELKSLQEEVLRRGGQLPYSNPLPRLLAARGQIGEALAAAANAPTHQRTIGEVAVACMRRGECDQALSILGGLRRAWYYEGVAGSVAIAAARGGHAQIALRLAAAITRGVRYRELAASVH